MRRKCVRKKPTDFSQKSHLAPMPPINQELVERRIRRGERELQIEERSLLIAHVGVFDEDRGVASNSEMYLTLYS